MFAVQVMAQDKRAYIEVKDTIEIAYNTYFTGDYTQNGFSIYPIEKSDSIGIDSVSIIRIYYLEKYDPYKEIRASSDSILSYGFRRIYLKFREKEYKNGCSSKDNRLNMLNGL
jgi:hypothetical protein